jgi:diguanylate cyclase (GGDEF)-like protein
LTISTARSRKTLILITIATPVLAAACHAALVYGIQDDQLRIFAIDITFLVWGGLASLALFIAARRSAAHSRRLFLAWWILGLAQLCYTSGDLIWTFLEVGLGQEPFPSWADFFYLLYYPMFLAGILFLPSRPFKGLERFKTLLDAGIVMLAALLGFWNFLLGPLAVLNAGESPWIQILTLAYPVGDLILLWALLSLLYRRSKESNRLSLVLLATGMAALIVTESIYGYQSMLETYASGELLDMGWVVSYAFIGLAGIWQAAFARSTHAAQSQPAHISTTRSWLDTGLAYMPYAWLVAAYLLLSVGHNDTLPLSYPVLALGVGVIISLVLIRQVVTIQENDQLVRKMNTVLGRVQRQTEELSNVNEDLQSEIESRKRTEEQLAHDALHDSLTGLPNRMLCLDRLRHALELSKRRENYGFSVIFLDLDQFKVINDSLGHKIGDQVLVAIANRLQTCVRSSDTVARLGGDEFVIILEDLHEQEAVIQSARRTQSMLMEVFDLEGRHIYITASIGIVCDLSGYAQPEEILRDADIAMYHAKASGKARFEIFNTSLRERAMTRLEMENDLREALQRNEFLLHYQPIHSLTTNCLIGFEALLRWQHPKRGLIRPLEFIPMAEETGLINPIGRWVLREACQRMHDWQIRFPQEPPLTISVNISGSQFKQANFVEQVRQALEDTGLKGSCLQLEITESVCLNSTESMMAVFDELAAMDIQFQIDDFGTGYSSLSYLQDYPIQTIKIDRAFIEKMGANNTSEIVRTIIAMAHDLGLDAIAEGIETEDQLANLKKFECNSGQGYFLNRPDDIQSVERLLAQRAAT